LAFCSCQQRSLSRFSTHRLMSINSARDILAMKTCIDATSSGRSRDRARSRFASGDLERDRARSLICDRKPRTSHRHRDACNRKCNSSRRLVRNAPRSLAAVGASRVAACWRSWKQCWRERRSTLPPGHAVTRFGRPTISLVTRFGRPTLVPGPNSVGRRFLPRWAVPCRNRRPNHRRPNHAVSG
jgi:hypothetical protein